MGKLCPPISPGTLAIMLTSHSMYFCSILVFSHTQPFSCYFGPGPLTWYCSSFSGFERQATLIQPQMVDVSKIIFSTTTDIRTTLESKRRTKCKLICQPTFCSMGMQSFICPCKFQDNFHIFCSSAGGFYQLMIHRKKPIDEGSGDTKGYFARWV